MSRAEEAAAGTQAPRRSEPGIDAYRGLVVVMMFAVHTRRIQVAQGSGPLEQAADSALSAMMWAEPYIAASFVFLAGYSLVLSRRRAVGVAADPADSIGTSRIHPRAWLYRMLSRAAWLYVLSALLFLAQFGWQWPDAILSSGILSAIALSLSAGALVLHTARPLAVSLSGALAVLALAVTLERTGASVSGLNAGPGGAVPLLASALLGVALGMLRFEWASRPSWFRAAALLTVAALGVFGGLIGPATATLRAQYLDYQGLAVGYWLTHGLELPSTRLTVAFWNHTAAGLLALTPLMLASWLALAQLERALGRKIAVLNPLGRHALLAYVAHLGALGITALLELNPRSALQTWGFVVLWVALSCALGAMWERVRRVRTS